MRQSCAWLDDLWIERLFQPASDLIQNWVGLSRASAACFCIDVASLAWIVSRLRGLSAAVTAWDSGHAFLDLAFLLLGLLAMLSLRTLFRRAGRKPANPLRRAMQSHRAIALLMLIARLVQLQAPALADLADLMMLLSAASALYLGACADRPPLRRCVSALAAA